MALAETKPALRSFRIVEAMAVARTSAACSCHSPLLILPFVITPRRASTLATVVRCHLPPCVVGFLRFNSFASAGWDTNPAAISFRKLAAKARARESAARRLAKALSIPFLRDDACPRRFFHHGPTSMASARQGISVKIVSCGSTMAEAPQAKARPGNSQTRTGLWPAGTSAVRSI
jgi:hypothetical protein